MTSGSWGSGEPTGERAEVDRGSAGAAAPATGSARIVIGMAALNLTILCVVLACFAGVANGLLVLATIFAAVFAWAAGAFTRSFWD
ncbi:hypothetical protein [Microbacterium sp. 3J1]|uniref:hypothetical protein n=1 Tax=Microbacterium sp. 3J1 TaxID=861269 RepID=UPI000A4C071A|nr:hypothetical protein [Microbacterium sp. 3J1]